jgi:hypothetical protein
MGQGKGELLMSNRAKAGGKIPVSDKIGFRLQARMGVPMIFNGLWVGTGGTGASVQIPVWQFDFSVGVILRLGS